MPTFPSVEAMFASLNTINPVYRVHRSEVAAILESLRPAVIGTATG